MLSHHQRKLIIKIILMSLRQIKITTWILQLVILALALTDAMGHFAFHVGISTQAFCKQERTPTLFKDMSTSDDDWPIAHCAEQKLWTPTYTTTALPSVPVGTAFEMMLISYLQTWHLFPNKCISHGVHSVHVLRHFEHSPLVVVVLGRFDAIYILFQNCVSVITFCFN